MSRGRLIGIGVGPGDPELLTLKAINTLQTLDLMTYIAARGSASMARAVVRDHLPEGLPELGLEAPMREGPEARAVFYEDFAARLRPELDQGRRVGVLCLGDPMVYGSFIYLLDRLRDRYPFEIVPGITSIAAAAARLGHALGYGGRTLATFPASLPDDRLRALLASHDHAAILKVGRHWPRLRSLLDELQLLETSMLLSDLGWPNEDIRSAAEVIEQPPYFSILLTSRS